MQVLPTARGPLTADLLAMLAHDPASVTDADVPDVDVDDVLADDDLQLALYLCYELHYRGLPGVDDRWEWHPALLRWRGALEAAFEAAVDDLLAGWTPPPATPETMDVALRAILDADPAPSLSRFVEARASLDQVCEFLMHRSAYQLKEADPHSWALPRLSGGPKAAMVEIQADEYGGGRVERMHARLFADVLDAVGLDSTYGAYVDRLPGITLATVNLMTSFGLHRRNRGKVVGHLAAFEMSSSIPNRRYGNGLRRLGFEDVPAAVAFFDEHVEADAVHENIAAIDLAGGLARAEPALAADVLRGAQALVAVEGRWAEHLMDRFAAGRSSLLPADAGVPVDLAA
jgi:hypothetical protein